MIFKKIVGLLLASTLLFSNTLNFGANQIQSNIQVPQKKTYAELLNALKTSPSGEHSFYLAMIYLKGMNTPDEEGKIINKDISLAKKYFNKSISLGYYNAAQILGSLYLYNEDFSKEENHINKALSLLKLALSKGLYEGTTALADIYINHKNEPAKGIEYLKLGATHNIPTAQLFLAILYNWGYNSKNYSLKKDPYTAQALLTQACTNKNITENVKNFCSSKNVKINKKKE